MVKILKDCGLNITIKMNLKTVDFLDVRFDLVNNTYQPYRKPNNEPIYISKRSNHPPNILKELPKAISKRISDISCNENVFNNAKITYGKALKNSGFTEGFTCIKPDNLTNINREEKKKRKRKNLWYNAPFSLNVKTNVGKVFFKIFRKNFPKTNPMSKIFNKNTVKISYSCTRNVKSITSRHNKQILHPKPQPKGCNCRDKNTCPLENKCLTPKIIYQADITNDTDDTFKYYLGLAETSFKDRCRNHISSFNNEQHKTKTELSKYVWSLKNENKIPSIEWKILKVIYSKATSQNFVNYI